MATVQVEQNISSNAGTLGEAGSDTMSSLTAVLKPLSSGSKYKLDNKESINQRCDLMLAEQIQHLKELQSGLNNVLDAIENCKSDGEDASSYIELAAELYDKAEHGSVLVSVIDKMQNELFHTRQDLQKLISSSDREVLEQVQDRVKWLENRIERVLMFHRQSVLDAKRAKTASTDSSRSISSMAESSIEVGKSSDNNNNNNNSNNNSINLGPSPLKPKDVTSKNSKSPKFKTTIIASTRTKNPSRCKSDQEFSEKFWDNRKLADQPLRQTLPLVPRCPIAISCAPFDRHVPWLDRKGSSYDLLREEFNELMKKVGKVYDHIQTVADNSHETDVFMRSPTNVSSRMSRNVGDRKDDYDCYGLEPPAPLKWGRMSRNPDNVYPRDTRVWHKGIHLDPVRRIATQQQQIMRTKSSSGSVRTPRAFDRAKLNRAKAKVMASVSLQRLNRTLQISRQADSVQTGLDAAQKSRIEFIMETNLRSSIAKVRQEAAKDLGLLYKSQPSFSVINALKSLVYTDDSIFVLIEASKSLLKIGVWDTAALEIIIQSVKYGSDELRRSLLDMLRTAAHPHLLNKQSVQFRVLHGMLINLIQKQKECGLSFLAAIVCAYFDIRDDIVRDTLMDYLKNGDEDIQSLALTALTKNFLHHSEDVIKCCLNQLKLAVKWENRVIAAELMVECKSSIDEKFLNNVVCEDLSTLLYDDCSREVRKEVAKTIDVLGLHNKVLQAVVKKLDDLNEDVRAQGVMSLSMLGIKGKSLLNQLLDILELDSSIYVRIQVMRAVKELNIIDRRVLRLLRERARGSGPMCKEAQISLYALTGETETD